MSETTTEATSKVSATLEQQALDTRIQLVARRSFVANLSTPIGAGLILLFAVLEQTDKQHPFGLWLYVISLTVLFSIYQNISIVLYKKTPAHPQRWLTLYILNKVMQGLAWGSIVWVYQDDSLSIMKIVIYVVLCAVCSAVVVIQSLFWRASFFFLLGILLPVAIKGFFAMSPLDLYFAIGGFFYFVILAIYSGVINRQLVAGVYSGLNAKILAKDLFDANLRTEQALAALQTEHLQLKRAMETIRLMAEQDELTQLMNRRAIMQRLLHYQTHLAADESYARALTMFDIDHFKNINDRYGHDIGDQILQQLAQRLSTSLLPGEMLARLGGEEFVILLTQNDHAASVARVEQLRGVINATPLLPPPYDFPVTASFGLATLRKGETVSQWLKRADEAMYKAKHAGRNRLMINI